ncbi:AAA family ATPase [uncultured Methanobacterium sp.]|uniref:AAA family ATPase n=1 Tax=uncultured Methanobacterium sp. TaxID=176306 RepID=UPI002AA93DE4|nr:AAA family ATPase [uncultured Methanobacterium sp.]
MKIKIYYGPKSGFEKFIPEEKTTLSELVIEFDARRNKHTVVIPGQENEEPERDPIKCLVAYSESYARISESAVLSFNSLINEGNIENLYLQNPPVQISNLLKEFYSENISYKKYKYNLLNVDNFLKINSTFEDNIIGQDQVKKDLLNSFYSFLKNYNNNKPIVLMFYGNSGIGKTETAKFLSGILGEELFRKQFSMFQNIKFSEYLFGGNHAQPSFAKELLERNSNVILLDEFDKAADLFHEAFYQLFDDGIFEDKNYKVQLDNAIIICTSNYQNENEIRKNIGDPLFFRFTKLIKFNPLSIEAIKRIMDINIEKKYEKLDDDDKKIINLDQLKKMFLSKASKFKNAREISNLIDEAINSQLVKNFIENS